MSLEILPLNEFSADLAVVVGDPDDVEFWHLVIRQAWDDEWFYGDGDPFDGQAWVDVKDAWAAFVRERISAPEWRWYVWRDNEDGETQLLVDADADTEDAFQAALVAAPIPTRDGQ